MVNISDTLQSSQTRNKNMNKNKHLRWALIYNLGPLSFGDKYMCMVHVSLHEENDANLVPIIGRLSWLDWLWLLTGALWCPHPSLQRSSFLQQSFQIIKNLEIKEIKTNNNINTSFHNNLMTSDLFCQVWIFVFTWYAYQYISKTVRNKVRNPW